MKSIYSKLQLLFIALTSLGVLYSGYILYSLPAELEKVSGRIDLSAINEAQPVFTKAYVVIGLTLFLVVIVLMQFLYQLNSSKTAEIKAFYDPKDEGRLSDDSDQKAKSEEDDFSKNVKEILDSVKQIKDEKKRYEKILSKLCMKIEASQGIFYTVKKEKNKRYIDMLTSFAFNVPDSETLTYEFGEGLAGQVAKEGKKINVDNIPEGYINILSGLGSASPNHLLIYPVKDGEKVVAIAEIASFKEITVSDEKLISEVLRIKDVKSAAGKPTSSSSKKMKKEMKEKK
jgi:hypothetical protein